MLRREKEKTKVTDSLIFACKASDGETVRCPGNPTGDCLSLNFIIMQNSGSEKWAFEKSKD